LNNGLKSTFQVESILMGYCGEGRVEKRNGLTGTQRIE